jgi:hypothetical protein
MGGHLRCKIRVLLVDMSCVLIYRYQYVGKKLLSQSPTMQMNATCNTTRCHSLEGRNFNIQHREILSLIQNFNETIFSK